MNKLYFVYGNVIGFLGILGFALTHAKSALISGLASSAILIVISMYMNHIKAINITAKVVNLLLLAVFSWRASLALSAYFAGNAEKLIPGALLGLMALTSLVVLALAFKKP